MPASVAVSVLRRRLGHATRIVPIRPHRLSNPAQRRTPLALRCSTRRQSFAWSSASGGRIAQSLTLCRFGSGGGRRRTDSRPGPLRRGGRASAPAGAARPARRGSGRRAARLANSLANPAEETERGLPLKNETRCSSGFQKRERRDSNPRPPA